MNNSMALTLRREELQNLLRERSFGISEETIMKMSLEQIENTIAHLSLPETQSSVHEMSAQKLDLGLFQDDDNIMAHRSA